MSLSGRLWAVVLIAAGVWYPGVLCAASSPENSKSGGNEALEWSQPVVPGPAVVLRSKQTAGKCRIYEGTMTRTQHAKNSYEAKDAFYLNVYCADRKGGMDRLAIERTYTGRRRVEILENGKRVEPVSLDNGRDLIKLGPNSEMAGNLRCYLFNSQNCIANRSETVYLTKTGRRYQGQVISENDEQITLVTNDEGKVVLRRADLAAEQAVDIPHVFHNENPHYFFPIFPQKKVAPGDTWRFKLPVIIPLEQGNPPRVLPTQFAITFTGRLREVRNAPEGQVAVMDYRIDVIFYSSDEAFTDRFPQFFRAANRVYHRVAGTGELSLDTGKGWMLHKSESLKITLYASSMVSDGADKPPRFEENKAEIDSQFEIHLLQPGSRLKSGAVIPEYD